MAFLRGLPDAGRAGRGGAGHRAAAGRDARPARDGRGHHRPDPGHLRVQPEQPDRHRGARGRTGRVPPPGAAGLPGRAGRGVQRVRPRPGRARWTAGLPGAPERGRAAYLLQGVRAGRAAGRLPGRAAAGGRGGAQDHAPVHGERGGAGRRHSLTGRRGGTAGPGGPGGQGTVPGQRRTGGAGLDGAADRGQLRLAPAGRGHSGLRRGLRAGRGGHPAVRCRGGPDLHRRPRRQRHVPGRGPRLPAEVFAGRAAEASSGASAWRDAPKACARGAGVRREAASGGSRGDVPPDISAPRGGVPASR